MSFRSYRFQLRCKGFRFVYIFVFFSMAIIIFKRDFLIDIGYRIQHSANERCYFHTMEFRSVRFITQKESIAMLKTIRRIVTIPGTVSTSVDSPFLSHDFVGIGAVGKGARKKRSRWRQSSRKFEGFQNLSNSHSRSRKSSYDCRYISK